MTSSPSSEQSGRLLYLVVCAAPPTLVISELIDLVSADGWEVCVIPTPVAATWIDTDAVAERTGHPVRSYQRLPGEPSTLPVADAVALVPATFNTINKWAAGIADTFALGILSETLGHGLPIVACPHAMPALTSHPAFAHSVEVLRGCGVQFTERNALGIDPKQPYRWTVIRDALRPWAPNAS